jgi:hypothetical protein
MKINIRRGWRIDNPIIHLVGALVQGDMVLGRDIKGSRVLITRQRQADLLQ